jgi:hypothetical protein
MFVYILDMCREAKVYDGRMGVDFNSCMSCVVFFTLKAYGRGENSCIFCVSALDSLKAGAFFQFTTGRMDWSGLCSFMRPFMEGAEGFRFLYFHLTEILVYN